MRNAIAMSLNSQPEQGAKGLPVVFDFTAGNTVATDLASEMQMNTISSVQAIWIDNRANAQPVVITFEGAGQVLQVRAGRQGVWPVFSQSGILRASAYSIGAVQVPTIFFNCLLTPWFMDI